MTTLYLVITPSAQMSNATKEKQESFHNFNCDIDSKKCIIGDLHACAARLPNQDTRDREQ